MNADVSVMSEILQVGGVLSLVLATALVVVWREYLKTQRALAELNAGMRQDARDNVRVIDGLTNLITNKNNNEEKILAAVTETLILMKEKFNHKIHDDGRDQSNSKRNG